MVLYIVNHNSYFDILLTYSRCPGLTGYIAKAEMLKAPLLRDWMKRLYCLFLDRTDIRAGMQTILTGIAYIKQGISICIFPEGTRNKVPDTFLPFHEGSFKIAEKSGCPIVPMCINNSAGIFEDHLPKIQKAHVILEYCKPIYIKELPKAERKFVGAYVQDIIKETYFRNKESV